MHGAVSVSFKYLAMLFSIDRIPSPDELLLRKRHSLCITGLPSQKAEDQ